MAFLGDIGKFVGHIGKEIVESPKDIANFGGHLWEEIKDSPKDLEKGVSNVFQEVGDFTKEVIPEVAKAFGEGYGSTQTRTTTAPIQTQAIPEASKKEKKLIDNGFLLQVATTVGVSIIVALILKD